MTRKHLLNIEQQQPELSNGTLKWCNELSKVKMSFLPQMQVRTGQRAWGTLAGR